MPDLDIEKFHRQFLFPVVRVRSKKAGGSGTVLYSKEGRTYILTNHHVVEDLIRLEKQWFPNAGREIKIETRDEALVESFEYADLSRLTDSVGKRAELVAWDNLKDLALLKLHSSVDYPYVAQLCPRAKAERGIYIFDRTFAVGASLGEPPVVTEGRITGFHGRIDNMPYWLQSAPTIFGNSGGAVFLHDTGEMIGVPARVAVILIGFGASAIPHMSWIIPITTVYDFLETAKFDFIFDLSRTPEQCEKEREELKRKSFDAMLKGIPDQEED